MTVKNIIEQVLSLLSHRVDTAVLYTWFNEIELMIQMQLLGLSRANAVQYGEQDGDALPIVTGQYQRVYSYWLLAKGHFRLQNMRGYERFRKLYVSEYAALRKWMLRTHGSSATPERENGVYLSAYSLACKHGFVGSEQEWLASLHGRDGADGLRGPQGEAGRDGAAYDLQYDSDTCTLRLLRDGVCTGTFDLTQRMSVVSIQAEQTAYTFALQSAGEILYSWSSTAGGRGSAIYTVNGLQVATAAVSQGEVRFAPGAYLQPGVNHVGVTVRDAYGSTGVLELTVNAVALGLRSSFFADAPLSGEVIFRYTPTGACSKTVYFELDGALMGSVVTTASGRVQSYSLGTLAHGHHTLRVWIEAEVGGVHMATDALFYDLICIEEGNSAAVVASDFAMSEVMQYTRLAIPYMVYVPGQESAPLQIFADGDMIADLNVSAERGTFEYVCSVKGAHEIRLCCLGAERVLTFHVTDAGIDAAIGTQDLLLWLDAAGRSNSEQDPALWSYTQPDGQVIKAGFEGFNWTSDGWLAGSAGGVALHVPIGGSVEIPYKPFATDLRSTGITLEVILSSRDVGNYESVMLDAYTDRGLEIRARQARLDSEQKSALCSFAEGQVVHLCFVIEPHNEQRLVHTYINGVDSGILQYAAADSFTQSEPANIVIGSADMAVELYAVRVYGAALSRHEVLENFIASAPDPVEMASRYRRNLVWDEYGRIVPASVPAHLPYLIIESDRLPAYKGDKLTCAGSYTDGLDSAASFTFRDAVIDVQGTSSQYYATKNFKIAFKGGFTGTDGSTRDTYALRQGQIATDTFCFKADVASSEGANNVKLADLYNTACPFKTAAQRENAAVRQGIDGKPILIFWKNTASGEVTFHGKYNFNHDKSTAEVFGFDSVTYPHQQSWEFRNNTSDRVLFRSADFSGEDWKNDFEARFPEDYSDPSDLARVIGWVASCDPQTATGVSIAAWVSPDGVGYTSDSAEYRLARFKAEIGEYFALDDLLWYYLFTELFLMIDSRAKNMFLTTDDGRIWYFLPYDFDTAIGINNEGLLRFSPDLEDVDRVGESDVYNGQGSVLWKNVRSCFARELREMYAVMRTAGEASYLGKQEVIEAFEKHQQIWGEAVFNEDCYKKYLEPLEADNDASYLPMAQGSKSTQRQYWIGNRFHYLDSKYFAGDVLADHAVFRGYAKQDLTLTPYIGTYLGVRYGSYDVQARAARGERHILPCPLDNVNDTEIILYGASCLSDVGDLSGFYPGYANLAAAVRLERLIIGNGEEGYSNPNLTEVAVGNNRMLRVLDVQNCPALCTTLALSGCPNIREVYARGSGITAVELPVGGQLAVLQLPSTLTSLTLRGQSLLHDFSVEGVALLRTLRIENTPIDSAVLIEGAPLLERVRLIGVVWELESVALLERLRDGGIKGLTADGSFCDSPVLSGTAYVYDELTDEQLAAWAQTFPELVLIVSLGIMDCTGTYIKDCAGSFILPLA